MTEISNLPEIHGGVIVYRTVCRHPKGGWCLFVTCESGDSTTIRTYAGPVDDSNYINIVKLLKKLIGKRP